MGSINKTAKGEYSIRFWVKTSDGLKQKRLTGFKTRQEAKYAELEFKKENPDNVVVSDKVLFDDVYKSYKDNHLNTEAIKYTSRFKTTSLIERHLCPRYNGKYLDDITIKDILEFKKELQAPHIDDKGKTISFSLKHQSNIIGNFKTLFLYAKDYFGLQNIPFPQQRKNNYKKNKKRIIFWTEEEFKKFIISFNEEEKLFKLFFLTLYFTGMRKGEAIALMWHDINFDNNTITVSRTASYVADGEERHKRIIEHPNPEQEFAGWLTNYFIDTPKTTTSCRDIKIHSKLAERLKAHHKESTNAFVFFSGDRLLPMETIRKKLVTSAAKAGIKTIRIHDLRHSHASWCIANNFDIMTIAGRLGHSGVKETLDTYAHMYPNKQDEIVEKLDRIDIY